MSDNVKKERLSALVDGELAEFETRAAIRDLSDDPALRRRWHRYHLVSDVMRGHMPEATGPDLLERVHRALEDEAAKPAPRGEGEDAARRDFLRPAAGFALAASVAVAAVLGIRALEGPGPVPAIALDDRTGSTVVKPQVASMEWNVSRPEVADRLNGYLVDHSASAHGMTLTLPYARVVSYDGAR